MSVAIDDRIEALRTLRAKVEAGDVRDADTGLLHAAFGDEVAGYRTVDLVSAIMNGTPEAVARALHEAVLPEWEWFFMSPQCACVRAPYESGVLTPTFAGECPGNPARAWFIAILDALLSIEEPRQ